MATIKKYTKKDGSSAYQFNVYLGIDPLTGKSKRTTRRGFKTQKEAKLALAQLQLEVESSSFNKNDYRLFEDIYKLWFEQYKRSVKETSAQRVKQFFDRQILPAFGKYNIDKITPIYCQKVVNEWAKEYKSFPTIKAFSYKIFDFAMTQSLIKDNPMSRIVMPKRKREVKDHNKQSFLDKEQLNSFLKEAKEKESLKFYTAFHTLAYTGLRKGELLALTWNDVNFDNQSLSVNKSVSLLNTGAYISTTKTTSSDRIISIDEQTISLLKKWKFEQKKGFLARGIRVKGDNEQLIFSSPKNGILYYQTLLTHLRKFENVKIDIHGFRHTHASLLFEAGATIKEVQERLGHSDVKTTLDIYTHVSKNARKDVASKLMNYMNS